MQESGFVEARMVTSGIVRRTVLYGAVRKRTTNPEAVYRPSPCKPPVTTATLLSREKTLEKFCSSTCLTANIIVAVES